jgi:putative transposase
MIERDDCLSLRRQCELLGLDRSGLYYEPVGLAPEEVALCHRLDELYTAHPHYGVRSMTAVLRREGKVINPKKVRRLLRQMGLLAIYQKPRLSLPGADAQVFPYLLRGLSIERPHQVWAIDITYVRLQGGFAYLVAVLDWFSRFVLAWELVSGLEAFYCVRVLEAARTAAGCAAEIINSDQGCQFTSAEWIAAAQAMGMRISHDGRGRALDNVMVERFWRSVKYEDIYLRDYAGLAEARSGLGRYMEFYNRERPHQSLEYRTPGEVIKGTQERTGGSRQCLFLARAVPSVQNFGKKNGTQILT